MNINFEKVPVEIFDWIEKFSFDQLSHSQKKEVLTYFSDIEYEELHKTFVSVKSISEDPAINYVSKRKIDLMAHFDSYHISRKEGGVFSKSTIAWQVAAMLFMLLSGFLFYRIFDLKKDFAQQQVASIDTVYVTKEIVSEPEVIRDTVYRYKKLVEQSQKETYFSKQIYEAKESESINEMEEMSTIELENLNTKPKGSSMKDDSLLRKFTFVAM